VHVAPLGDHDLDADRILTPGAAGGEGGGEEQVGRRNLAGKAPPFEGQVAAGQAVGVKPEVVGAEEFPAEVVVASVIPPPPELRPVDTQPIAFALVSALKPQYF
jgi:hypothetical protein